MFFELILIKEGFLPTDFFENDIFYLLPSYLRDNSHETCECFHRSTYAVKQMGMHELIDRTELNTYGNQRYSQSKLRVLSNIRRRNMKDIF